MTKQQQQLQEQIFTDLVHEEYDNHIRIFKYAPGDCCDDSIDYDSLAETAERMAEVICFLDEYSIDECYYLRPEYYRAFLQNKLDLNKVRRLNAIDMIQFLDFDRIYEIEILKIGGDNNDNNIFSKDEQGAFNCF